MISKRFLSLIAFLLALGSWSLTLLLFSPPHFLYQVTFCGVAGGLLLLTYFVPLYGFFTFVALIPLASIPSRVFAFGAHEALLFISTAFVLGWWLNCLVTKTGSLLPKRIAVPLFFIIFCAASSALWTALRYADFYPFISDTFKNQAVNLEGWKASNAIRQTLISAGRFLVFPSVFWASFSILSKYSLDKSKDWLKITLVWSLAIIPSLAIAMYQYLFDGAFASLFELSWVKAGRVSGGLTDPNAFGLFLLIFVPLAIVATLKFKSISQMFFILISLGALFVLTLSGSRSAILGMVLITGMVGSIVFIFASLNHKNKTSFIAGALVVALIVVALGFSFINNSTMIKKSDNPLLKRLSSFVTRSKESSRKNVFDKRELQWKQAISVWKDYPLAGIGVGAFPIELANYNSIAMFETPIDNAWNQYLNWLAEFGAIGVFFWIWFYFACARALYSGIREKRFCELSDLVLLSIVIVFQLLFVFGAHLQSTEVSAGLAIVLALALIRANIAEKLPKKTAKYNIVFLSLIALVIVLAQMQNATGPLSCEAINQKYNLPHEYGFYRAELWPTQPDGFYYQWSQKNAGKLIEIPQNKKVLRLKMAGMNPDISAEKPHLVKIYLKNLLLDSFALTSPDWVEKDFFIYNIPAGKANLSIQSAQTWQPKHEVPPRSLGIALATNIFWVESPKQKEQGFSPWFQNLTYTNVPIRWSGLHSSCYLNSGSGKFRFALRAPAPTPFYKDPVSVSIFFAGSKVKEIVLPKDASWTTQTINLPSFLHNQTGFLSFSINRLTKIRVKGSVRKEKVGFALTNFNFL